jgi:putative transposase
MIMPVKSGAQTPLPVDGTRAGKIGGHQMDIVTTMQRVERHIIDRHDPRWSAIDAACFLSKNLYNAANYIVRQTYLFNQRYIPYAQLDKLMKHSPDYCALPRKVSQWVLKQVDHDWQAFFAAQAAWQAQPETFQSRPHLPGYKPKTTGRNLLTYTSQAVSRTALKQGFIQPSQLAITVKTQQTALDQVRIVPRPHHHSGHAVVWDGHPGDWQERWLEAGGHVRQKNQSEFRATASCPVH